MILYAHGRIGWAVGLAAASCLTLIAPPKAFTYDCGSPSEGHCYAVAAWGEQPEYFAAYTDITQARLEAGEARGRRRTPPPEGPRRHPALI